jgi:hypothetical protein
VGDDRTVSTTWVTEYGIWRLDKAGDLVTGDKTLAETKKKQKDADKKLRDSYDLLVMAGYSYIVDSPAAIWLQGKSKTGYFTYALDGFIGLVGGPFVQIDGTIGLEFPVKRAGLALLPFADIGVGMRFAPIIEEGTWHQTEHVSSPGAGILARVGLALTSRAAPGLFGAVSYQFNAFSPLGAALGSSTRFKDPAKHFINIGIGYAL